MSKAHGLALVGGVAIALALSHAPSAQSVPLVFQTTFNCSPWLQTNGTDPCLPGDGIGRHGDWTMNGKGDELLAAANYPGGGGGLGFRHWRGDGTNAAGGGISISLPQATNEVWVRMYMRFQAGFGWVGGAPLYTKDHYWGACGSGCIIFGIQGSNSWGINYNGSDNHSSSLSWAASQGGPVGDGQWHAYEYHVLKNGASSVVEFWFEGVRYLSKSVNLGTATMTSFSLGENQSAVTGCPSGCYTDYDDLAISTTGYIGPTFGTGGGGGGGGGATPVPSAPTNVRLVP